MIKKDELIDIIKSGMKWHNNDADYVVNVKAIADNIIKFIEEKDEKIADWEKKFNKQFVMDSPDFTPVGTVVSIKDMKEFIKQEFRFFARDVMETAYPFTLFYPDTNELARNRAALSNILSRVLEKKNCI